MLVEQDAMDIDPITPLDILGWLGSGLTEEEILARHPELRQADINAAYDYAERTASGEQSPV